MRLILVVLTLLSTACGCAKSKSTSAIPVSEPPRVVMQASTCRIVTSPPKRPIAVHRVVVERRKTMQPDEQEASLVYINALEAYAHRVHALCGEKAK